MYEYKTRKPTDIEIRDLAYREYDPDIIVEYKGACIPVYMDDYGQCYFVHFGNQDISLGIYNTCLDDVCYIYDRYNKGNRL